MYWLVWGNATSAEGGVLPWSLQPTKIASCLGRGMRCGVSSAFWPLQVGKSAPGTSIILRSSGHLLQMQILRPHPVELEPAFSQGLWLILCSVWSETPCPGECCLICSAITSLPSGRALFWGTLRPVEWTLFYWSVYWLELLRFVLIPEVPRKQSLGEIDFHFSVRSLMDQNVAFSTFHPVILLGLRAPCCRVWLG